MTSKKQYVKKDSEQEYEQEILDEQYMRRALLLAQHAYPAPNPQVGAVLVKNNKIIGEGYHDAPGQPHAEIIALQDAEKRKILPDGATLYVTLEPCSHFGKTPPCVDAIVVAGIKRVVIGCVDQHEIVHGHGATSLVQAGIQVHVGVCGKECTSMYKNFFHLTKTKRPCVTLKAAFTLDGKISSGKNKRDSISCEESQLFVQHLRRDHDAVLVGVGTVCVDDPQLNCRISCKKQPVSVIVDSTLRIPLSTRVLKNQRVIIATTSSADKKKKQALEKKGVEFVVTSGKHVSIPELLQKLPQYGILSVLVEGGAEINSSFFATKSVDHLCFFIAPKIFGSGVPILTLFGKQLSGISLKNVMYKQIGIDILVEADVCSNK